MELKTLLRDVIRGVNNNSPAILTTMAAVGVVSTAVLAARGAVQADRALDEHREGPYGLDRTKYMSPREKFDITWRYFVPAAISGSVTILCLAGAQSINTKRNAAIMGLYTLTDRALTEYQDKAAEIFGEGKERNVHDRLAEDRMAQAPVSQREIVQTQHGDHLCFDQITDRYFTSSTEHIRQVVERLNEELRTKASYVTQNTFLKAIGLTPVALGDQVGWTSERLLKIVYTSTLDEYDRPATVLNYRMAPVRGSSPF